MGTRRFGRAAQSLSLALALAGSALGGCGSGTGTLEVTLGGEQAAEQGWPFEADGETFGFVDGWSLRMDRVLVAVDEVRLASADGEQAQLAVDPIVVDLHGGPQTGWRWEDVPARRWDDVSWRLAAPTSASRRVGAAEADVARMVAGGYSLLLEAELSHPEHGRFEVSVGFPREVWNQRCEREDGTLGVVVGADRVTRSELTFHLDHVFYDSLGEREPQLRFEAWAAAAGADRVVTLDELATQSLADLRGIDGEPLRDEDGAPLTYDVGSEALASPDLRAFAIAAITTVGHFEGEGHCAYAVR